MTTDLPYAGTSGWSGSATSQERAAREDADGTTSRRQDQTLFALAGRHSMGLTWRELGQARGWHHGQASGVLSVLHKTGRIARLVERRDKCAVYVLPDYVGDRTTAPHGSAKPVLSPGEQHLLRVCRVASSNAHERVAGGDSYPTVQMPAKVLDALLALIDSLS